MFEKVNGSMFGKSGFDSPKVKKNRKHAKPVVNSLTTFWENTRR